MSRKKTFRPSQLGFLRQPSKEDPANAVLLQRSINIWLCFALFFLGGCSTLLVEIEQQRKAGELMEQAEKLEQSCSYSDAASLYTQVADHFSKTRYFKKAVHKAAYLYADPENPAMDIETSLHWFRLFSKLKLWKDERENTEHIIAILEYLKRAEDKYSEFDQKVTTFRTKLADKSNEFEEISKMNLMCKKRVEELKEELDRAKTALERLKEIDKKLHENRIGK